MSQFAKNPVTKRAPAVINTVAATRTHEGGAGYTVDPRSELFMLSVTSMWDNKYYEATDQRRERMASLVKAIEDPEWMLGFVSFLRNKANIRSMAVAVAVEYAMAGGEGSRKVIDAAVARADEPAEILGYLFTHHGKRIKSSIKRGIGDAVRRTWNEYTALKYDGQSNTVRMADVLNLCHVKPRDETQSALFEHLLNRRHGHKADSPAIQLLLSKVEVSETLRNMPKDIRRKVVSAQMMKDAGWTWENLAGWLPDGMDAEAWEAAIPSMGYFALLRNLRNFTEAGVSQTTMSSVLAQLSDLERVAKSRVLPFRFFTAYQALDGDYQRELGAALEASFANAPKFGGNTLIMVDTSGSMGGRPSEQAAVLATAFRRQCESSEVFAYALDLAHISSVFKDRNVLRDIERLHEVNGQVGYATHTWSNTQRAFATGKFDRVVVLTDMQDHPERGFNGSAAFAGNVPVYVWDLSGHRQTNVDTSKANRFLFTGLNDKMLQLVYLYEQGKNANWEQLFNG